jgi:predicted nicotinamide N-methyase
VEERPTQVRSRAVLWVAAWAFLVIIVAVAIVAATRSPSEFEAGTPEAAAQAYLQALLDGDERTAHGHLSEQLQTRCSVTELRHAWRPESLRITLTDTVRFDDTAEVELIVIEGSTDPFGGGGEYDITLVMQHTENAWVISEAPWPIEYCEMEEP